VTIGSCKYDLNLAPFPGHFPVLDVTPVLWGDQVMDWLYHFGEGYEEKFTGEELTKR